ncbi:MAG: hypothetical protein ACR2IK_01050 [Chloroflexota bacterium]
MNLSIITGAVDAAWRRTGVMARVATVFSILLSTQAPVVTTVAHARISTTWVDNAASTPVHDHWMADLAAGHLGELRAGETMGRRFAKLLQLFGHPRVTAAFADPLLPLASSVFVYSQYFARKGDRMS